jgi:hypothetical protein
MGLFPTPPTPDDGKSLSPSPSPRFFSSIIIIVETEKHMLEYLLDRVQYDVLESVDLLDLSEAAEKKLDQMIGELGTCVEPEDVVQQVCATSLLFCFDEGV